MSELFGADYAQAYDAVYAGKDYEAECDLVERVFAEHGARRVNRVLDLGCGTGGHAIPLARRGYNVVGVDRSASMLAEARAKAADVEPLPSFVEADIRDLALEAGFDAALMLFAVLSYQLENEDVISALSSARRHLAPGALLVFDVWFGPAVLTQRPSRREVSVGELVRTSWGELDALRDRCSVSIELATQRGEVVAREEHVVRYFFPHELELLLDLTGFELLRLGAFPGIDRAPDETSWNVFGAARAAGDTPLRSSR